MGVRIVYEEMPIKLKALFIKDDGCKCIIINKLLGTEITKEEIIGILNKDGRSHLELLKT